MVDKKAVVIGAGIAGLSISLKLRSSDFYVVLLEGEQLPGGHSVSVKLGNYYMDLGPHIFRSANMHAIDYVKRLVNTINLKSIPRIYKYGNIFDNVIPVITENNINKLRSIKRNITVPDKLGPREGGNFEEILVNLLGWDLYWEFFGEYSEKWWGLRGKDLDPDLVPRRLSIGKDPQYSHYTAQTYVEELYPSYGGFQEIPLGMYRLAVRSGVDVRLAYEVVKIECDSRRINIIVKNKEKDREELMEFDNNTIIYSTIPLDVLSNILGLRTNYNIDYRGMIFAFFRFRGYTLFRDYSWLYLHEKRLTAGRLYDGSYYNRSSSGSEETVICVEVPSNPGDGKWENDVAVARRAFEELVGEGLVKLKTNSFNDVLEYKVVKTRYAYPRFRVGYKDSVKMLHADIKNICPNIRPEGRNGRFVYWNSNSLIENYLFGDYLEGP
ncbi:MAG: FAD-dependent oxidoreductase [Thermoproteus sp.]